MYKVLALLGAYAILLLPATPTLETLTWTAVPHESERKSPPTVTSNNWSGYVTTGATYTDVKGTWTQPAVQCSPNETSNSAFWVGIDGDDTNSVEQLGTSADCVNGTPHYYGWWEMYPSPSYSIAAPQYLVRPGDVLTAEVKVNGATFVFLLSNATRNWTFTTTKVATGVKKGSAEWIVEAPSNSHGILPLANFTAVTFSNCTANGAKVSVTPHAMSITMTSASVTKAQPSLLTSGANFTVTWHHH